MRDAACKWNSSHRKYSIRSRPSPTSFCHAGPLTNKSFWGHRPSFWPSSYPCRRVSDAFCRHLRHPRLLRLFSDSRILLEDSSPATACTCRSPGSTRNTEKRNRITKYHQPSEMTYFNGHRAIPAIGNVNWVPDPFSRANLKTGGNFSHFECEQGSRRRRNPY